MSSIRLKEIVLPDFGVPDTIPAINDATYGARLAALRARMAESGLHALVVYADREHAANFSYLTGFDPRFEEAILVVVKGSDPVIATGPENQGRAAAAPVHARVLLYPPFGLMGQDRTKTRPLADLLADAGIAAGQTVGVAGWKYFGPFESDAPELWSEAPSFLVDGIRRLAGSTGRTVNASAIFMDSQRGLRAINEIDQLAQFEYAASHASEAIRRVLFGLRPGMRESEAARLMQTQGYPLSAHPMLTAGPRAFFGLESPGDRVIQKGDPLTSALGLWGGLTCRAGWVAESADDLPEAARDYVERLVAPYYETAIAWYEAIGIGASGGALYKMVWDRLGDPFFGLILNPGHLIHYDEWMNTPIYPDSTETLRSHQAVQLDIIPATGSAYFTTNIEDGIALLDANGRAELAERHPGVAARIQARRAFMGDVLGIRLKPEVLPFSNLAGYLTPYMLAPRLALVRS